MITLYYVPMTRALRARWLLEELGVTYQLHRLDVATKENRRPDYLKLNPHGHVPTIDDDGVVVYESAAICLYLADKHIDKGLAPRFDSPLRGPYYQWMVYSMATLEPPVAAWDRNTVRLPEDKRDPARAADARRQFLEVANVLEKEIGDRPFLVGDGFTAADVMVGSIVGWARLMGLLTEHPKLEAYAKGLFQRPAAKRARAD